MTSKEISIENILSWGYYLEEEDNRSGISLYLPPSYFRSSWDFSLSTEKTDEFMEHFKDVDLSKLMVTSIRLVDEDVGTKSFSYEADGWRSSIYRFPIMELIDTKFKDIEYISISYKPKKIGQIADLDAYDSSMESQQVLFGDCRKIEDPNSEICDIFDDEYQEAKEVIEFSSCGQGTYCNGDYTLVHGPTLCEEPDISVEVDCRISEYYNDSVIDDFWTMEMEDEDPFGYIDPADQVSVYHRKGKDWFVSIPVSKEEIGISYVDTDGEYIEDRFFEAWVSIINHQMISDVESQIYDMKRGVSIRGDILNRLGIGSYNGDNASYVDTWNPRILGNDDVDLWDMSYSISDYVDYKSTREVEDVVDDAYDLFLEKSIDNRGFILGKYKHLQQLREIVEKEGKKIIKSIPYGDIGQEQYAISYGKEDYHFRLSELLNTSPKKFYREASAKLTARTLERIEKTAVIEKSKHVFVGFEDSTDSGNCSSGTRSFCSAHSINTAKVGGIRGDVLLAMDYSGFTRRAVAQAITRQSA